MKKKMILSALLAVIMLISAFPLVSLAEPDPQIIFSDLTIEIEYRNFPDENFREYVRKFDTNKDGSLTPSEREVVTKISPNSKVFNYEGIKYFPNITEFTAFPTISSDYALYSSIPPISLDLRFNTKLNHVYLHRCKFNNLYFLNNPVLWTIGMNGVIITGSLDLSGCPNLVTLNMTGSDIKSLELRNHKSFQNLFIDGTANLEWLDVSGCPNLVRIEAERCNLKELDISANPKLYYLLLKSNNNFTSLELGVNHEIRVLDLERTKITGVNISGCALLKKAFANGTFTTSDDNKTITCRDNVFSSHRIIYPVTCLVSFTDVAAVFEANNGSNETKVVYAEAGTPITAPDCNFDAPAGMRFGGWKLGDAVYQPGHTIHLPQPATFIAVWSDASTPEQPEEPTQPGQPEQPTEPEEANLCKWDNKDHGTSFGGRLTAFFHSILWFFAHLFGLR